VSKGRIEALKKTKGDIYGQLILEEVVSQIRAIHATWFSDVHEDMEAIFLKSVIQPTLTLFCEECSTNILSPAIPSAFHSVNPPR